MPANPYLHPVTHAWSRSFMRGVKSWWHLVHFGAIVLVMALSPSTYNRVNRATTSQHIYASTWLVLPWFTALSTLLSVVLIRVVVVTASSYGLSQYALEMVVRVLVIELIPLSAAMFVTLRTGLAGEATLAQQVGQSLQLSIPRLRRELVPRVMADAFSVLALAVLSSVIALVLTYITVHGLTLWGLPGFTRSVGHVFDLTVSLGFILKTLFFSLAVAIVPLAALLDPTRPPASAVQPGAVRLFLVLLMIEAASLAVKYI
jgi:phospholipid/cholesterol/gamma-HCH transport system permease protein